MKRFRRRFVLGKRGSTAIEFAFVAPVMSTMVIGTLSLCLGAWTWNALQEGASETARCLAINSTLCASVPTGCDSTSAGICYAEQAAARRGVPGVTAGEVTVSSSATCGITDGSATFTTVTYAYRFSLLGFGFPFHAAACFPNAS